MTAKILNHDLLPGNVCFGCGPDNPGGLHIEVRRDPDHEDRLVGALSPAEHMIGFPGITHGGVLYTAMDCLGAWTPAVLRRDTGAFWILRSAAVTYHRPAKQGREVTLHGWIEKEAGPWDPIVVRTEARDPEGNLLADGTFKVVPLDADRFREVSGVEEIPANWLSYLNASRTSE
jgi:acyl-coenzyme A thioesterase PaaI-like protein